MAVKSTEARLIVQFQSIPHLPSSDYLVTPLMQEVLEVPVGADINVMATPLQGVAITAEVQLDAITAEVQLDVVPSVDPVPRSDDVKNIHVPPLDVLPSEDSLDPLLDDPLSEDTLVRRSEDILAPLLERLLAPLSERRLAPPSESSPIPLFEDSLDHRQGAHLEDDSPIQDPLPVPAPHVLEVQSVEDPPLLTVVVPSAHLVIIVGSPPLHPEDSHPVDAPLQDLRSQFPE